MKDIDEIRRDNLRRLETECGTPTATAQRLNMSLAQFANLRDGARDSKTGKRRGMRKDTARRIETDAGKPPGWLDVDRGLLPPVANAEADAPPAGWEKLDALGRAQVAGFIQGLLLNPQQTQHSEDDDRPKGD